MSQNPTEGADSNPSEPGPANPYSVPAGTPYGEGLPPYHSYAPPPPPYSADNPSLQAGYRAAYPPAYSSDPQAPLYVRSDSQLGPDDPTVLSQPGSWPYSPYPLSPEPTPSTPPPPPPRKKGKGSLVLFVAVALAIVVGSVLGIVLYTNYQNNVQKTAADATDQVQANASSTANAQATATYIQTHYPFSANLVLSDPLNNNSSAAQYGWETNTGCVFTSGAYRVTAAKQGSSPQTCTAQKTTFTNFTYQIQLSIETGGDNAAGGIFFRADPVSNQGYIILLRIDGYYEVDLASGPNHFNTIQSGMLAAHGLGFHQVHTLGIVANGSHISVYLDQNQITLVSDTTFTSGKIGVFSQFGSSSTMVAYTNAKVWQL